MINNKKPIFGNYEVNFINFENREKIINYLYSKIDLSNHRYSLLKDVTTLKFLKENEHYLSPNFKGTISTNKGSNYLLIVIMIDNRKYCVAIDRKKLSYHKNQLDMKTIQLFQINLKCNDSIFKGSIFDGKLINIDGKYVFMILDCFYLEDNNMLSMDLVEKLNYLDNFLKNNFIKCNNFEFKLNKLFRYSELEDIVDKIKNNKFNNLNANGLIFFPKKSGNTIIYLDTINNNNINNNNNNINNNNNNLQIIASGSYHIIYDFVNFLKSRTYSYETNKNNKKLWLTKTLIPDVYNVYENITTDKIGIALIPNLKISHMCSELINDTPILFNCVFNDKFKKWVPINPIN
jgi:hypothetical protein